MRWSAERLSLLQEKYASHFEEKPLNLEKVKIVAGVDAAYSGDRIAVCAFASSSDGRSWKVVLSGKTAFPYLPGFFAFREGPWAVAAVRRLPVKPDLLFVDGNGRLHPRKAGLAVFVGVRLALPTVGFTKNPFYMKEKRCSGEGWGVVKVEGERLGIWFCRRGWIRPVFLSQGNLIGLDDCLRAYLKFSNFKVPFPLRQAHHFARQELERLCGGG